MQILHKVREADKRFSCAAFIPESIPSSRFYISVKDNLCVRGMPAQAGSRILEGYVPPFNATAVQRVLDTGGVVVAKTVMDEFGFGTFNVNTYKIPKNPHDETRSTGGSSGGSACLTAVTAIPSVVESTGGSITAPAAFCGVVGVTPTYGLVSRYGLIDYANSLDKIGTIATSVKEAFELLYLIAGPDPKDPTSTASWPRKPMKGRIALPKEMWEKTEEKTRKQALRSTEALEENGVKVDEISLAYTQASIYAYYIMAMSEASTNLAKYCGLRYGAQPEAKADETCEEYFSKVRSLFGPEAKRRLLLGSFARTAGYRGKYYDKAARVRTLVINELKRYLEKYDAFLTPSMPCIAPRLSEIKELSPLQHYSMDICTNAWNLAGLPHVSVPFGKSEGMPVGVQIIADHFQEKTVEYYAKMLEERS